MDFRSYILPFVCAARGLACFLLLLVPIFFFRLALQYGHECSTLRTR